VALHVADIADDASPGRRGRGAALEGDEPEAAGRVPERALGEDAIEAAAQGADACVVKVEPVEARRLRGLGEVLVEAGADPDVGPEEARKEAVAVPGRIEIPEGAGQEAGLGEGARGGGGERGGEGVTGGDVGEGLRVSDRRAADEVAVEGEEAREVRLGVEPAEV
jgi:hypothetical protein